MRIFKTKAQVLQVPAVGRITRALLLINVFYMPFHQLMPYLKKLCYLFYSTTVKFYLARIG